MTTKNRIYYFSVFFPNPYEDPPDGKLRVLIEIVSDKHRPTLEEQKQIDEVLKANPCYAQGFTAEYIGKPRKWSDAAKYKN